MTDSLKVNQTPVPGEAFVRFCGDLMTFTLTLSFEIQGRAFVRTNLGGALQSREETINEVENSEVKLNGAWYDVEMQRKSSVLFSAELPLIHPGHFQAKCFFIPEGSSEPVWPGGENTVINLEPAGTCCSNIIYNAFVRQFVKSGNEVVDPLILEDLDKKNYTVIPQSGKFRELKKKIEFILINLGCRIIHLLPVHPVPTTYARMGRFGSPYAALNFKDVDPGMVEFDTLTTPLEQFMELVDTIHFFQGLLILDIAINHTGWGSIIHESHPEWLIRDDTGRIEQPGAWGTTWADLTKLDYSKTDLWQYMADIFLLWCSRGVDGFRCDAGYMIPVDAWKYITAKVRQQYPDTVFLLEGLGGSVDLTIDILNSADFNWAYSELFQNYTRQEIENYFHTFNDISSKYGTLINYAETHDNLRLASSSRIYAKLRTSLAALLSFSGGFGFANGVEWFADQKIDVHELNSINWGNRENQVKHIARLNKILRTHSCFFNDVNLKLIHGNDCNGIALLRHNKAAGKKLLVLINLDLESNSLIRWNKKYFKDKNLSFYDLITHEKIMVDNDNDFYFFSLQKGRAYVLTQDKNDLKSLKNNLQEQMMDQIKHQRLKAKVLNIYTALHGYKDLYPIDIEKDAENFNKDPVKFLRSLNNKSLESRVVIFNINLDIKREVMIPPGFFLLVLSSSDFRAEIMEKGYKNKFITSQELAFKKDNNRNSNLDYFALFLPVKTEKKIRKAVLKLRIFNKDKTILYNSSLVFLPKFENIRFNPIFCRKKIFNDRSLKFLQATDKGGMFRASALWGNLESRYDALIAANLNKSFPENRWIFLNRLRIWASYQGYSRKLDLDCLKNFSISNYNVAKWEFHIPTSRGKSFVLELVLKTSKKFNALKLFIQRPDSNRKPSFLSDREMINLIIRPDIDDRNFHDITKALNGPEHEMPKHVKPFKNGFTFEPDLRRKLHIDSSCGTFILKPQWNYMVNFPLEAQRGLDSSSDMFSPGYFDIQMPGNGKVCISAAAFSHDENPEDILRDTGRPDNENSAHGYSLKSAVFKSLDAFIVNRERENSIIAGFPWFLDWGRDSLIFCRALIQLKRFNKARGILKLFGRYEENGTLPNMICGDDIANRETSDAPLWFFACVREIIKAEKSDDFLHEKLQGRTVKQILLSIADSLLKGTKTGLLADKKTSLLFSPSHYTWMDTNYPAGTPRQGYPIEIQALWHYALEFLSKIDQSSNKHKWINLTENVKKNIHKLFYIKELGYFSDCLHADKSTSAIFSQVDDALRPNQLLLITLGVIKDKKILIPAIETLTELLVPGAIRSLANRKVCLPLKIIYENKLLKDPFHPYSGKYEGNEELNRKPAYHNGTAWTWQFPMFSEAWFKIFGKESRSTALALLGSSVQLMEKGAAGYIPEIVDGNFPHYPRGCDAQAWGSSELARVISIITQKS